MKKILVPALPVMAPDTTFSNTMKKMQLLKSFDWEAGELDSELAIKMNEWLDDIEVPSEERPKQNEWKHTTLLRKEDNRDRLIMFFDESTNQLYVVEYFL